MVISNCRGERRYRRTMRLGNRLARAVCKPNSVSSNSKGPPFSARDQSKPMSRSVPSEKTRSSCLAGFLCQWAKRTCKCQCPSSLILLQGEILQLENGNLQGLADFAEPVIVGVLGRGGNGFKEVSPEGIVATPG